MKLRYLIIAFLLLACGTNLNAKGPAIKYVPGSDLTLIGKVKDTPNRYSRIDTIAYTGFTDYQRRKLNQQTSGLALAFTTDSKTIWVDIKYKEKYGGNNTMQISGGGVDLYIKRDGKWAYAGSTVPNAKNDPIAVVNEMAPGTKECVLYLPLISIINEIYVGVDSTATIKAMPNPFNGKKVVFFGSSFTHGTSTSRAGMAYPLQLQRETGLDVRSLGMSGNSRLQQSYARVLADCEADAFVFDAFSNSSAEEIEQNFDSFVKTIREKHPTTPIIFQQTIYRERRNFNTKVDNFEAAKMAAARKVVTKAMKNDPNIYFIIPSTGTDGVTTVDGIHPSDLGYWRWMQSIKQPILNILNK